MTTDEMLTRRKASVWTKIHPLFALGQLAAFVASVSLLIAYAYGTVSFNAVHQSVLVKIALMLGAVVTGALWERDVYGQLWFAPQFFFEDVMTVNVLLLHVGYLAMAYIHPQDVSTALVMLALAYTVYIGNVAQYILRTMKLGKHSHVRVRN